MKNEHVNSGDNIDVSTDLLFPVPETLSPRLAWMKRHGVITYRTPFEPWDWLAGISGDADMKLDARRDWFANEVAEFRESRIGVGMSEDEAIVEMLKGYDIKLWNEEAGV